MNAGGVFTYTDGYSYNDDSYAFIECTLLRNVGDIKAGTLVPEALINMKSCTMKLNLEEKLHIIPFSFNLDESKITVKKSDESDSDFDSDSDSDESGSESEDDA